VIEATGGVARQALLSPGMGVWGEGGRRVSQQAVENKFGLELEKVADDE